jgi:hypothetical protein
MLDVHEMPNNNQLSDAAHENCTALKDAVCLIKAFDIVSHDDGPIVEDKTTKGQLVGVWSSKELFTKKELFSEATYAQSP